MAIDLETINATYYKGWMRPEPNVTGFSDPAFDELIEQLEVAATAEEFQRLARAADFHQVENHIYLWAGLIHGSTSPSLPLGILGVTGDFPAAALANLRRSPSRSHQA